MEGFSQQVLSVNLSLTKLVLYTLGFLPSAHEPGVPFQLRTEPQSLCPPPAWQSMPTVLPNPPPGTDFQKRMLVLQICQFLGDIGAVPSIILL